MQNFFCIKNLFLEIENKNVNPKLGEVQAKVVLFSYWSPEIS